MLDPGSGHLILSFRPPEPGASAWPETFLIEPGHCVVGASGLADWGGGCEGKVGPSAFVADP